ncbi:hypothetical protein KL905_003378 [Ogataea polymorpha]|uniref:Pyridoxamine 5'-phosphate oxidase Alr4036 family FMN-binding domain-containing protein n=1 Tax=Ogataea polymorpha TaxID=460523 RepID=A0A9P8TGB7_9ASCO|nr:hypothetical protein KL937_002984 [Ogataea polymorpha]KAG7892287.1 hypothetical protein KL908_003239 [Ogataea polymorpha]KAG7899598.1 hypothetical protein KL907_004950 [Ogataea polymorpha]KAG7916205.1 hypothetical protein KL927_003670 [Ogataea polymorpha]KAG7920744.1 hypothetical protein KL905_003378 [Ogataea polymorpha]
MLPSLAPWNSAFTSAVASELESEPFVPFSFSNVGDHGIPHTRTCVFRGFLFNDTRTNVLLFTCDKRSAKFKDLIKNSNFEACFYFHKARKQFRFSGAARVITNERYPIIDLSILSTISNSEDKLCKSEVKLNDVDLVVEQENDFYSIGLGKVGIDEPLMYKIVSPSQTQNMNASTLSLADLNIPIHAPTEEEWKAERQRCWNDLSRSLKRSFKRPPPGSLLTSEKYTLLDSINRGVDGTSSGQENFVVVCMFVKAVDLVELTGGVDKRYLYKKSYDIDVWKEYEVCP